MRDRRDCLSSRMGNRSRGPSVYLHVRQSLLASRRRSKTRVLFVPVALAIHAAALAGVAAAQYWVIDPVAEPPIQVSFVDDRSLPPRACRAAATQAARPPAGRVGRGRHRAGATDRDPRRDLGAAGPDRGCERARRRARGRAERRSAMAHGTECRWGALPVVQRSSGCRWSAGRKLESSMCMATSSSP